MFFQKSFHCNYIEIVNIFYEKFSNTPLNRIATQLCYRINFQTSCSVQIPYASPFTITGMTIR